MNAFWRPENLPWLRLRDSREYADGLREVLERAIADRLQPGTAAGSHLSRGLDSSSVTALAAGLLQKRDQGLLAFTAVPTHATSVPGGVCDEGPNAASVAARYLNVEHVLVRHGKHSVFSMIDRFSSAQQEPVFNAANYDWLYEICLQARQLGVETLQTGLGGNLTISYDGALALLALARRGRFCAAAQLARDLRHQGIMGWRGIAGTLLDQSMPLWVGHSLDRLRLGSSGPPTDSLIRREFAASYRLDLMQRKHLLHGWDSRALRLSYLRMADPGPSINAFRQLSGVSMTDPTTDKRVMDCCFSVPVEYFCEKGIPRSLIRNAMAGRLPEQIRGERRRGLQAADFAEHFRAERQEALDELRRLRSVDLAARALDLPEIERLLQPESQIGKSGRDLINLATLIRALSLGRFLRRMEDGTLLSQQDCEPALSTGEAA